MALHALLLGWRHLPRSEKHCGDHEALNSVIHISSMWSRRFTAAVDDPNRSTRLDKLGEKVIRTTLKPRHQWLVFARDTHGHSWRPAYEIVVALGKTTLLILRKAYFRVMNPYHGGTPGYRLYRRDGENQIVVPVKMLSLFSLETLQRNRRRWFRTLKLENISPLRKRAVQLRACLNLMGVPSDGYELSCL